MICDLRSLREFKDFQIWIFVKFQFPPESNDKFPAIIFVNLPFQSETKGRKYPAFCVPVPPNPASWPGVLHTKKSKVLPPNLIRSQARRADFLKLVAHHGENAKTGNLVYTVDISLFLAMGL